MKRYFNAFHAVQKDLRYSFKEKKKLHLRAATRSSGEKPSSEFFGFGNTITGIPLPLAYSAPPQSTLHMQINDNNA